MRIRYRHVAAFCTVSLAFVLAFMGTSANGQVTTGTLSGTVYDVSGAVVPRATVTLMNQASGSVRTTLSNGGGYFSFPAILPGTYTVSVAHQGFKTWEATGIAVNSGSSRSLSGIKLTVGTAVQKVEVSANAGRLTPINSGAKSEVITQKVIQNVPILGMDATDFVKIMPGMAYTTGGGTGGSLNVSSLSDQDDSVGGAVSPAGSLSANGQRQGAIDITADGADLVDPGCNCGALENPNIDMTAQVKVETSNFGADSSKGPIVISTIGKSGGRQFHGEVYTYERNYAFDAADWQDNRAGKNPLTGQAYAPKPTTRYSYPGFNIGGPVIFPGSDFNKNHDKMFFFFGIEGYRQEVDNGVYNAVVPTQAMRQFGNFTQTESVNGKTVNYVSLLNGYAVSGMPNGGYDATHQYAAGVLTAGSIKDSNGQALMDTYPLNNIDPAGNHGFNYTSDPTRTSNSMQYRGRVDFNISDSTKLYVSYNYEHDNRQESLDTLWTGNAQSWASPTTPYPSPIIQTTSSDVLTVGLTKVINPTLTNELIFNYSYLNLPNTFQNFNKVDRAGLGLTFTTLFPHANLSKMILPQTTGWGDGISNYLNSGFELNGIVYAKKTLPNVSDNVVKVWGNHTSKFGFFWQRTWNSQPGNSAVNGTAVFSNWGDGSSGNAYADMLEGNLTNYSEQNFNVVPQFRYMTTDFYAQDSWKATRRVTLDYGVRFSHLGPWVDTTGFGFASWYPNLYQQYIAAGSPKDSSGSAASGPWGGTVIGDTFPGLQWHKVDPSVSAAGSGSTSFFVEPRVGFAWDIFGTGKTVLRGGYGEYRFHDEQNVQNGAYGITQGSFGSPGLWGDTFYNIKSYTNTIPPPSGVTALVPTDNQEPRTRDYSLTIDERLPWQSLLEFGYSGNQSDYLSNYNNSFDSLDLLPLGTLFNADVCGSGVAVSGANNTGTLQCGWLPNCNPTVTSGASNCYTPGTNYTNGYTTPQQTAARPYNYYSSLKLIDHKMYSNYNSLQVSWNKMAGPFDFLANYTWSKAMGIRGENGSGAGNPTALRQNYGTLPNDRRQIVNFAYIYRLPHTNSSNRFARAVANGWQVAGVVQYQSGPDIQTMNYNFGYNGYIPTGSTFMGTTTIAPMHATNQNVLGSGDITLQPRITCNPRANLKANQYFNGACFSGFSIPGVQGANIFPDMAGPAYFDSDINVYKDFVFGKSESKSVRLKFDSYNFSNHPLWTFTGGGDPAMNLVFNGSGVYTPPPGVNIGSPETKVGHRIMQGGITFSW